MLRPNDEAYADYRNPKVGGVYKLKAEVGLTRTDAQFILPLAGADILSRLDAEIPWAYARGEQDRKAYDQFFKGLGLSLASQYDCILSAFMEFSAHQFDYVIDPVDATQTSPTSAFQERFIKLHGAYGYVTVNGVVVHGSRVNNMLWAVWGRGWWKGVLGTLSLKTGARFNQLRRSRDWDNKGSQNAIQLGGDTVDRLPNWPSELLVPSRLMLLRYPESGLVEGFFWPSPNAYSAPSSDIKRPPFLQKPPP